MFERLRGAAPSMQSACDLAILHLIITASSYPRCLKRPRRPPPASAPAGGPPNSTASLIPLVHIVSPLPVACVFVGLGKLLVAVLCQSCRAMSARGPAVVCHMEGDSHGNVPSTRALPSQSGNTRRQQ